MTETLSETYVIQRKRQDGKWADMKDQWISNKFAQSILKERYISKSPHLHYRIVRRVTTNEMVQEYKPSEASS
jgi:hypothetical protein